MQFFPAGREIADTVRMSEAVCLAVHGRPSADVDVYANGEGDLRMVSPWGAAHAAKLEEFGAGFEAILVALSDGRLRAYAVEPSNGRYALVPRLYWIRQQSPAIFQGEYVLSDDADALAGQPVLVVADDLAAWAAVAADAVKTLKPDEDSSVTLTIRSRSTPRREALRKFLDYYNKLENPIIAPKGDVFHRSYMAWCRNAKVPHYERSAFFEELSKIRSGSAPKSTNDNA